MYEKSVLQWGASLHFDARIAGRDGLCKIVTSVIGGNENRAAPITILAVRHPVYSGFYVVAIQSFSPVAKNEW
ncbi:MULTISPECIES: hypothetical protein [Burkholderia cepacia complex]|nr:MULTISPECIES: hypothetical protein [Burkholderia cepacia complex]